MATTADIFVKCCMRDELPSEISVICDYFGKYHDDRFVILFGVYQGLVKYKDVEADLLHKCMLANRLDELIEKKYSYKPTYYYKLFRDMNMKISKPCTNKDMSFEIYDDDYCSYCQHKGFITENNFIGIDCPICYRFICKHCMSNGNEEDPIHMDCRNKNNVNNEIC